MTVKDGKIVNVPKEEWKPLRQRRGTAEPAER